MPRGDRWDPKGLLPDASLEQIDGGIPQKMTSQFGNSISAGTSGWDATEASHQSASPKMEKIVIGTMIGDHNAQLQERGLHSTRSPPARKLNKQRKL